MKTEIVDLPADQYHADPIGVACLSSSIAQTLISKSPLHAYHEHYMLGGVRKTATPEMREGSILDSLLLCDGTGIITISADNYRTKAAQEERDAALAAGLTPVIASKLAEYQHAADCIAANLDKLGVSIYAGQHQVTIFWAETADNGNQVQCKARLDQLDGMVIRDLKKAASANPDMLGSHCVRYGYHIQVAAYLNALAAVQPESTGVAKFEWMFVEAEAPYAVCVPEPDGMMLQFGKQQWQKAVNTWERCLRTNEWPGYRSKARLTPPSWAMLQATMQEEI